jgi:hypothetical protein
MVSGCRCKGRKKWEHRKEEKKEVWKRTRYEERKNKQKKVKETERE